MELQAELVHAEPGRRVVRVSAWRGPQLLGSALGEAEEAETAEDRAIVRLRARLGEQGEGAAGPEGGAAAAAPGAGATPGRTAGAAVVRRQPAAAAAPKPAAAAPPAPEADGPDHHPTSEPITQPEIQTEIQTEIQPRSVPTAAADPAAEARSRSQPPAEASPEPPMDPEDWSQELVQLDLQLQRLGWGREQEGIYLERAFGHPSRSRLTRWADLTAFLRALEGLSPPADPATAPVPLQRRDLLATGDTLLERLGWDGGTARRFLAQALGASSRQQLDDAQLLQFNMLLEEAWMASQGDMRA